MRGEVANDSGRIGQSSRLAEAIREVKNAAADRDDVVVEIREATRMRLELLAAELAPIFAQVPADIDAFDFTISTGLQPRLWIDSVAHVSMGRDRRTYRFLKDTRIGRVVLAESPDMKPVVDQVTRYIAERLVDRERMLEGGVEPALPGLPRSRVAEALPPIRIFDGGRSAAVLVSALAILGAGVLFGLGASLAVLWTRAIVG